MVSAGLIGMRGCQNISKVRQLDKKIRVGHPLIGPVMGARTSKP